MAPAAAGLRFSRFVLFFLILGVSIPVSCGLEVYPYLEYVEPSEITRTMNTVASIRLPTGPQSIYFRHFAIYYRIYISGLLVQAELSTEQLADINQTLARDYNTLLSYTNIDSTPTNMGSVFSNQKYYPLALEKNTIDTLLGTSSSGSTITLDFESPAYKPSLSLGNNRDQLFRYSEPNVTVPYDRDNRYFVNSSDINDGAHIDASSFTNLDIQNNNVSGPKYTYVSMYILSTGIHPTDFSNIFSIPTFIGVFLLPNE
jgi:hypothetical protein